jgi:riboflavin kinase/FMN adenylyltransferase
MKLLSGIRELKGPVERSVVTVGNFDGLHRGHRQILSIASERAESLDAQLVVFTFRPHPTTVFAT